MRVGIGGFLDIMCDPAARASSGQQAREMKKDIKKKGRGIISSSSFIYFKFKTNNNNNLHAYIYNLNNVFLYARAKRVTLLYICDVMIFDRLQMTTFLALDHCYDILL
jgi:hypothetical protein